MFCLTLIESTESSDCASKTKQAKEPKTTSLRATSRKQLHRLPCTSSLPGKTTINNFSSITELGKSSEYKCSLHWAYSDLHDTHPRTKCKTWSHSTALPNSLSPACCTILIAPGIMVHGAPNCRIITPRAWQRDAILLCALLLREKRRPFQRLSAPSLQWPEPWRLCAGFAHCLIGLKSKILMSNFPGVVLEIGSCLTNPDFSWLLLNSPLWGQTESGDRAATTLAKSWPLLCSVIGIYLWKGSGGRTTLLGDFAT